MPVLSTTLDALSLLCLITGLAFVIFEMIHPGFGAPGILGGILLAASVLMYAKTPLQALMMVIVIIVILGIALTIVLVLASKGKLPRNLILQEPLAKSDRYIRPKDYEKLIGKEGFALTVLRPAGTGNFDDVLLDVVTENSFIQKDSRIKIIRVEGNKIVVRALQ